ncbi:protein disulfide-isomerase 1-like isoform X2 [Ptychodera flava]|uniref:protein disulfide-isomerase 1-like isoform X2 n=1 Tax=Ptychodera flava TaxID=63121 RepID=UPI003969F9C9
MPEATISYNLHKRVAFNVEQIKSVDASTFDFFIIIPKEHALVLIFYYAPWCRYCKDKWNKYVAVEEYFADRDDIKFGRVNCDHATNRWLCTKHGALRNYPYIQLYKDGHDIGVDVSDIFNDVSKAVDYLTLLLT